MIVLPRITDVVADILNQLLVCMDGQSVKQLILDFKDALFQVPFSTRLNASDSSMSLSASL